MSENGCIEATQVPAPSKSPSEDNPRRYPKGDKLSPLGDKAESWTKSQQKQYKALLAEIHADIELIDKALFRLGANLDKIRTNRLYFCGGYPTFQDFCAKELHTSRQQAFRLIQASETIKGLLEAGISEHELPTSERLCREIRKLSPDQQAPVWRAVLRQVQLHGRKPTVTDVQDSAVEVIKTPSVIERQQTELLQRARGVVRGLKFNIDFVAMTPAFREKFVDILSDIVARVQTLILSLTSPAVAERVDKKDSDRTCTQIKESAK